MEAPTPVLITTRNRPRSLFALLSQLAREDDAHDGVFSVRVLDDCSGADYDYSRCKALLGLRGWEYERAPTHHGRARYAELVAALGRTLDSDDDFFLFLQDDVEICPGFWDRVQKEREHVDDPRLGVINLHVDALVGGRARWTDFPYIHMEHIDRVGWFDLAGFFASRALFEICGFHPPGHETPTSSGVPCAWSRAAIAAGLGLYRVKEGLVLHTGEPSQMHPIESPGNRSASTTSSFVSKSTGVGCYDWVASSHTAVAAMATIPGRVDSLRRAVDSLRGQVAWIGVYLNGFDSVPPFLDSPGIKVARSQDHGDKGDAGKFHFIREAAKHFYCACDDDIVYPLDYVTSLVQGSLRNPGALVGFHGAVLPRDFVGPYYRQRSVFHFAVGLDVDSPADVLGTGVMGISKSARGYGASALRFEDDHLPSGRGEIFPVPNGADAFLAAHAQAVGVPRVVLAHPADWLVPLSPDGPSIYEVSSKAKGGAMDTGDAQTRVLKDAGPWERAAATRLTCRSARVAVVVNTCNRPDALRSLLLDLDRERDKSCLDGRLGCGAWVDIAIVDDSDPSHDYAAELARENGCFYLRTPTRLGKRGFWRTVNMSHAWARSTRATHVLFLQDDMVLCRDFFGRLFERWGSITDHRRATLSLATLSGRADSACWTGVLPRDYRPGVRETAWCDNTFFASWRYLNFVGVLDPIKRGWDADPTLGSGVGQQVSLKLHGSGQKMYACRPSLITWQETPSLMNPQARELSPNNAVDFIDEGVL